MKCLIIFIASSILGIMVISQTDISKVSNDSININFKKMNIPFTSYLSESVKLVSSDKEGIDQNWFDKAMESLEKDEYNISYNEELGAYQSPNRANNIRFIYHKDGFTAVTRDVKRETQDEWSIDFKLSDVKRQMSNVRCQTSNVRRQKYDLTNSTNSTYLTKSELSVAGNKASIEDDNIRINYTNEKEGMRQDFIIKKKQEGDGKLRLIISADTKLKMIVGADALMFKDKKGIDRMKYSSLKCWDANGKELRAYFEESGQFQISNDKYQNERSKSEIKANSKSEIPNPKSFFIVVNDDEAVYPITIDPLSSTVNWTAESNQNFAYFGNSVCTAGDVNGDGYSDVIIGASGFDFGASDEGKAFVYHGSATGLSLFPNWTALGGQLNANFGSAVSTAGDVNGDGYSDVIVGAFKYDFGETDEGRAFVFYGSATGLSLTANWTGESNQVNAQFGWSVSTAGDINGDGFSDVIVGSPLYDNGETDEGRAFVYYGSGTGLPVTPSWTAESNQIGANFGFSVSTGGDVNGDGYSDVIAGANNFTDGQVNEGKTFVYHGSVTGLPVTANWTAESNQSGANFGWSVATAGDVNGDGYSDVIIGSPYFSNGETTEGRAFVYHGSGSGLSDSANWTAESNQPLAQFGISVSTAGDVNGDGYSDVISGASQYDNGMPNEGRVYVYYGSDIGLSDSAKWTVNSNQSASRFGWSVSTAGDVNGDGYSDVIIGAMFFSNGNPNEGKVFVYHGTASGLSDSANLTIDNNQDNSLYGWSVSSAGDVNGDGYSDVIVGSPYFDNGENNEGRAFVYHGSLTGLSASPNWTVESNQANSFFSIGVSAAGDVNGDGYSDVIISGPFFDNGETNVGRVFVYHGSPSGLSATANWTSESNQANANFGLSISTAGDVNGDGYSDVIVGAPNYDNGETDEGGVYVYHGSALGLSQTANWNSESNQTDAYFGWSVSTAGDVNGDGYSDVIIGAYRYDSGELDEGKAFVYQGSISGLSAAPNWTSESNQASATYGWSVSLAGDVNGDGYSDVVVGSNWFDNGEINEGRAFVYHGSVSGLSASANWTAESNQELANFGDKVSTAGDVNGDGYSDVIVGAQFFENGNTNEGKAFVYHGSVSGLSMNANWTAEGNQNEANYASSVSTAGDVNGDGYSDVIVGALRFDNTGYDEGKVFVYYGNGGTGLRSTVQQYKPGTGIVVASGGLTGTNGEARLNIFGKSPFGRADGKIVYEFKNSGVPFSGTSITNSTGFSGTGTNTDLGTSLSGIQLNKDVSGLMPEKVFKWRARVQYDLVNNPYQKYGPWKYYNNYIPVPSGNFRATNGADLIKQLHLKMFIQGFYNPETDLMVADTVTVYLRNSFSPFAKLDSSKAIVSILGQGTYSFLNASNGIGYYISLKHRNSIETWSKTVQQFTASALSYDFTTANTQAYGCNMPEINTSPVRYGIYSGDENQNGIVDLTDVVNVSNNANAFVNGYVSSDMNGDNLTDLADVVITYNNSVLFVAKVTP